jgi:hypothetical protein
MILKEYIEEITMKYFKRWLIMLCECVEGLIGILSFGFIRLHLYKYAAMRLAEKYYGTYQFKSNKS